MVAFCCLEMQYMEMVASTATDIFIPKKTAKDIPKGALVK
jgi:hypothetical protein